MAKGIGAGFKIDNASAVLTNVSGYLRGVNGASDVNRLDGTVLQPDVAAPIKTEESGFRTRSYTLNVKYSAAAFVLFAAIEGLTDLHYEFAPLGFTAGNPKISGLCNVLSVAPPSATTDNLLEFQVQINATSQAVGTY